MRRMMTKSAVVAHLAEKATLAKRQIAQVLDELHRLAAREARRGGFALPGFGKLVLSNRKARMGRNPQTGEPIKIAAKRVVKFRVAKGLKDAVLGSRG